MLCRIMLFQRRLTPRISQQTDPTFTATGSEELVKSALMTPGAKSTNLGSGS